LLQLEAKKIGMLSVASAGVLVLAAAVWLWFRNDLWNPAVSSRPSGRS
jgi:hypothetical protein